MRSLLAWYRIAKAASLQVSSPLHIASFKGHDEFAEVLIQSGVDVRATTTRWTHRYPQPRSLCEHSDQSGPWTGQALHLAAINKNVSIVGKLLAYNADGNAKTGRISGNSPATGKTALQITLDAYIRPPFYKGKGLRHDEQLRIAQMLVEHGTDVRCAADTLSLDEVLRFEKPRNCGRSYAREYLMKEKRSRGSFDSHEVLHLLY